MQQNKKVLRDTKPGEVKEKEPKALRFLRQLAEMIAKTLLYDIET